MEPSINIREVKCWWVDNCTPNVYLYEPNSRWKRKIRKMHVFNWNSKWPIQAQWTTCNTFACLPIDLVVFNAYHCSSKITLLHKYSIKELLIWLDNAIMHLMHWYMFWGEFKCHPCTMQWTRSCNAFLLNTVLVSSGEVEVEIFLSDRVKPLQQNCILALGRLASTVFLSN